MTKVDFDAQNPLNVQKKIFKTAILHRDSTEEEIEEELKKDAERRQPNAEDKNEEL